MTTMHLVRHGRTAWNRELRTMGWLDIGIEEGWLEAAEATADVLERAGVTRIVSSPLARARQTAEPLARRRALTIETDDAFGELRVAPWEGLTEVEIAEAWPDDWRVWRSEPHRLEIEGRETLGELNARVGAALDALASSGAASDEVVALFTHDAVIRAAVAWALGVGPEIYRHVDVANCSITTVRIRDGVPRLVSSSCTDHLRGLACMAG